MTYELRSSTITFEAALRDLESPRDRVRVQAAHALGDVATPEERARAVPALIRALQDSRFEVRVEAALSLGDLESEGAVPALAARCADEAPAVRQAAVIALGRLGFGSAFDAVARALAEGPPDLRFQAATSLAEIDAERAREPLLAALGDGDGEVVGAVAVALGTIGEARAIEPLAALLESWTRPETRFDIAYALADLGDARAVDVLGGFVDDRRVGWDAIEALERLGVGTDVRPRAGSEPRRDGGRDGGTDAGRSSGDGVLLGHEHADADAVRTAAAGYLAPLLRRRLLDPTLVLRSAAAILALSHDDPDHLATGQARQALLAGLGARKREHRGLAVDLLARVGGRWAVGPLQRLRSRRAGKPFQEEIGEALARLESRGSGA
ncbi:MAG TPA: HEAT repeat domain-containing protein [Haliangium sp.]|nr:HEAT repeat domain-containing protein [Haliangium sp.]